jgi:putative DNA primase/helicase
MASYGIRIDGRLIADGRIHRYHVPGDKKGSRNAWVNLRLDGTRSEFSAATSG